VHFFAFLHFQQQNTSQPSTTNGNINGSNNGSTTPSPPETDNNNESAEDPEGIIQSAATISSVNMPPTRRHLPQQWRLMTNGGGATGPEGIASPAITAKKGFTCLSLDGGGMRGLVSIVCLMFASRRLYGDESLVSRQVDWLVGCSTGICKFLEKNKLYNSKKYCAR
jgi:hypothetical protein